MDSKKSLTVVARLFAVLVPVILLGVFSTGCHHERYDDHHEHEHYEHHDDFRPGPGAGGY